MDSIKILVEENLVKFNMPIFTTLDLKTQERLVQIQEFIESNSSKVKSHIEIINKLKLNISLIADDESVKFTRKTIYNNDILKQYIEKSIEEEEDYFNFKKIKSLSEQLDEINSLYNNIVNNILDYKIMEMENSKLKDEIKDLLKHINELSKDILEKEKTMKLLRSKVGTNVLKYTQRDSETNI